MANGFGNRFLYACVRRARFLPLGGNVQDGDIAVLGYRMRRAVETARGISQVTMTPEAIEAWVEIYPFLSDDRPGLLGSLTARSEAQVVRLAMIYALFQGADQVSVEHLMAGAAVEQYSRDSVEYLFGDLLGDPIADTILAALRQSGKNGLTRTEISALFARRESASQIADALMELTRRGLAAQRRGESPGGGRAPETWVVTIPGAMAGDRSISFGPASTASSRTP